MPGMAISGYTGNSMTDRRFSVSSGRKSCRHNTGASTKPSDHEPISWHATSTPSVPSLNSAGGWVQFMFEIGTDILLEGKMCHAPTGIYRQGRAVKS